MTLSFPLSPLPLLLTCPLLNLAVLWMLVTPSYPLCCISQSPTSTFSGFTFTFLGQLPALIMFCCIKTDQNVNWNGWSEKNEMVVFACSCHSTLLCAANLHFSDPSLTLFSNTNSHFSSGTPAFSKVILRTFGWRMFPKKTFHPARCL